MPHDHSRRDKWDRSRKRHWEEWRERYRPDWPHEHLPPWRSTPRRKGEFLFLRFFVLFGLIALMITGGIAALAYLFVRLFGGQGQLTPLVWLGGCGLSLALPLLAIRLGLRGFRSIASPLADVMDVADAVAQGDLSQRVEVRGGPGDFRRLANSFNRMVDELERSDRQRRNLTADVAHELRTPLHILQGNLEGILDGVYQPTTEHIEATLDETRLLARLVEDLQTLSQAESGQLHLVMEPLDIGELFADIQTSFSGQAEAAGVELLVELDPSNGAPPVVEADIDRMGQVLGNLVSNALRHTPQGGTITLRAAPIAQGLRIQVQDTGAGIPPEDLPYIFDRFWRGDRSRSHAGGAGSGLGLAITRQLVRQHGGAIQVESQVGVGTTFTIELPTTH
jgi:two-component system sensor histidine kinase BaeS